MDKMEFYTKSLITMVIHVITVCYPCHDMIPLICLLDIIIVYWPSSWWVYPNYPTHHGKNFHENMLMMSYLYLIDNGRENIV